MERIFSPFTQGDSSVTKKFGGTGLGLSISKHYVELMGGEIWATSILDRETTFNFTACLPPHFAKDFSAEKIVETEHDNKKESLKILLVDDSFANRFLVTSYLKDSPHVIIEAEDGASAFEIFKKERFDFVLMDIQMPIKNGYESTRDIRAWENEHKMPRTPIFALTAYITYAEEKMSLDAGCDMHITKPLKKETLMSFLESHGDQAALHGKLRPIPQMIRTAPEPPCPDEALLPLYCPPPPP